MPCAFYATRPHHGAKFLWPGCQFSVPEEALITVDGKSWCHYHCSMTDQAGNPTEKAAWDVGQLQVIHDELHRLVLDAIEQRKKLDFTGVIFPEAITFDTLPSVSFYRATFFGGADFTGATFTGETRFTETTFTGNAKFEKATFSSADFSQATFHGGAEFAEATFDSAAMFEGAIFRLGADFSKATFPSADFSKATFQGRAKFTEATFDFGSNFAEATFGNAAMFEGQSSGSVPSFQRQPSPPPILQGQPSPAAPGLRK